MILSVLREFTTEHPQQNIECLDVDLDTSMEITSTLFLHSKKVLDELYKNNGQSNKGSESTPLYGLLPTAFNRQKAIEVGETIQLGEKAVEAYLTELVKSKKISRVSRGNYSKSA